jgi:ribosome maturation factor RimP
MNEQSIQASPTASYPGLEDRIGSVVEGAAAGMGLYLVEVSVRGWRGSQVVDVFVDSDGPLDVEALARLSRDVAFVLDTEEVMDGRYTLNVSSPGVDRPLRLPRQFKKNTGRTLRVDIHTAEEAPVETVQGELVEVGDEAITLKVSTKEVRQVPFRDIVLAKVQLPW